MLNPRFSIGDRVTSRGVITREFGIGQIMRVTQNVATVVFNNEQIRTFKVNMLRPAPSAVGHVA